MNNILFLLTFASLIFIFFINVVGCDSDVMRWKNYKKKFKKFYGKTFANKLTESRRQKIFNYHAELIDYFNSKNSTTVGYKLGINHLTDLFLHERRKLYGYKAYEKGNRKKSPRNSKEAEEFLRKILSNKIKVPEAIDWRKVERRVTPVKDQGLCSSCWAFATTGALEGQLMFRNTSYFGGLSEQNLIDCSKNNCEGGTMESAMVFIKNGIDNDHYYPYVGVENDCKFDRNAIAITDSGAAFLTEGDEQELKAVVAKFGPVSVAIYSTDDFSHYRSGVYYNSECSSDPLDMNHGVLVVGYDTDPQYGDYWIVKNSWSSEWGEEGYIRMARNRENNCGIASAAVIPTF